jgi:predicted nucleotidyltransferase component of viral defense system
MIDKKVSHSIEWLNKFSELNNGADKILVEKTVRALTLLEGLVESKLNFIFKGGTALMLMQQNNPKRLSIDIDIIIPQVSNDLLAILEQVSENQGFIRVEGQERNAEINITKEHFKFFYIPTHLTNQPEEYILLDILYEENPYQKVVETPVSSPFLFQMGEVQTVKTPSFEDILGDKMTAFAPNTTGIPYYKGKFPKNMEIIKQLYDVANLLESIEDLSIVRKTFKRLVAVEAQYRELDITPNDVLQDTYQTCLCLALRGADGIGNFEELLLGIKKVSRFIFSENFSYEKVIVMTGRIAYLTYLVANDETEVNHFKGTNTLKDLTIIQPHNTKLNKLKKQYPEAFWYWWLATNGI